MCDCVYVASFPGLHAQLSYCKRQMLGVEAWEWSYVYERVSENTQGINTLLHLSPHTQPGAGRVLAGPSERGGVQAEVCLLTGH